VARPVLLRVEPMTAVPDLKKRLLFVDDETMLLDLYKMVFEEEEIIGRLALPRVAGRRSR